MKLQPFHPSRLFLLVLILAFSLVPCSPLRAQNITHTQPDFTFVVPPGFEQFPVPAGSDAIYFLTTSDPAAGPPGAIINIRQLHGMIAHKHQIIPPTAPPDTQLMTTRWKSFDVDLIVSHTSRHGIPFTSLSVQIPLQGNAIEIVVVASQPNQATANAALQSLLNNLNGNSNWPTPGGPGKDLPYYTGLYLAAGVASLILLFTQGAKAARRGLSPGERSNPKSLGGRHIRARNIAIFTAILCAITLVVWSCMSMGTVTPEEAEQRGARAFDAVGTLSLWIFSAAYGITRGYQRLRHGPAFPPVPVPTIPPITSTDAAAKFDEIR